MTSPPSALPAAPAARPGSDHARLTRRVAAAGLLDPAPRHYAVRAALLAAAAAGLGTALVALGPSPAQLLVAAGAAVLSGQVALLAHDVAHRQVLASRRASAWAGRLLGNLGIGLAYGWWQVKHTRHHADPNHVERDPDVQPGALVFTADQARAARGPVRWVHRHQAALFVPMLCLAALDMRRAGVAGLRAGRAPHRRLELGLVAVHVLGYAAVLLVVLPPVWALAFAVVHQALFGIYLGSVFAPNHKGMLVPSGRLDFLRKQVLTSRNVRGGRLLGAVMGGLDLQIEHHLFPSMPSPHLRRARPIVREFCVEIGVPYHEASLVESWRETLGSLRAAGRG